MSGRSDNEDEPTTGEMLIGIIALALLFCLFLPFFLLEDYRIFEWILTVWIATFVFGVIWKVFFPFSD